MYKAQDGPLGQSTLTSLGQECPDASLFAIVRRSLYSPAIIVLLLLSFAAPAWSQSSISLVGQSGGTYTYQISPGGQTWDGTPVLVLSGLQGVTGASVSSDLVNGNAGCVFSVSLVTSTTVALSVTANNFTNGQPTCSTNESTYGTLTITSTVTTAGTVNFKFEHSWWYDGSPLTGTVTGPTAPLTVNTSQDVTDGSTSCTTGGTCSLRDAILQSPSGGSIAFNVNGYGIINLNSVLPQISGNLTITGPSADRLTISGQNKYLVFNIASGTNVTLSGMTIANGNDTVNSLGGGIFSNGSLTVNDCVFTSNTSPLDGGAIANLSGSLTVLNSTFTGNSAASNGGAIESDGSSITVAGSTFSKNFSANGGGAIATGNSGETSSFTGSGFYGNYTTNGDGGAIMAGGTTSLIKSSSFYGNHAGTYQGGAIWSSATLTMINDSLSGNYTTGSSSSGGGVFSLGTIGVVNSSFFGNSSPGYGGAIYGYSNGSVSNSVFADNSATGQFVSGGAIFGGLSANYNVYWNNQASGSESDCGNCTSDANRIQSSTNPLALPISYYGGKSQTLLPQPGSTAICAAASSLAKDENNNSLTVDGRGWPVASNCTSGHVDAGAVQTNYLSVQNSGDAGSGAADCPGINCTLRDAIALANSKASLNATGMDIQIPLSGTITLNSGSGALNVTGVANIGGPGANLLSISGGNSISVFTIGYTASLYGVTVTGGNAGGGNGAGILNNGTLTIASSAITGNNNTASVTGGVVTGSVAAAAGGGVYNSYGATLKVFQSTIAGNSAGQGGGIMSPNTTNVYVIESTVSNNIAYGSFGSGGGIYAIEGGDVVVQDSTITGNTAISTVTAAVGGGIDYPSPIPMMLSNTIVAGNSTGGVSPSGADMSGVYTGSGNLLGTSTNGTSNLDPGLSALQLNGLNATVPTMIPLPGSAAICAGAIDQISAGAILDERGYPNTNSTYSGYSLLSPCVDAGAVQTNYYTATGQPVQFVQQPPSSTELNNSISPAITVQVLETNSLISGPNNTDPVSGIPITLNLENGLTLSSGTMTETTSGTANFSDLVPSITGSNFSFSTSAINVVSNGTGTTTLAAATSNAFTVVGLTSTTTPSGASVTFNTVSQSVTLSAAVTSTGTVSEGTITFTVLDGSSNTIGSPVVSDPVSSGAASVVYSLPDGTPAGSYTIQAAYTDPGGTFANSTGTSVLTVSSAASITSSSNATTLYSAGGQSIPLSATVTSAAGTVNEGSVLFTLMNASSVTVGSPTAGAVSGNVASVNYTLPAGLPLGPYTIQAAFSDTSNDFASSSDNSHTLSVTGIAPTITSANSTSFFAGIAGSFTITTTGTPAPTLSVTGTLPTGLTFTDHLNGSATISGTATGTAGAYPLTITASNSVSPDASQSFTLNVSNSVFVVTTTADDTSYYGNAGNCPPGGPSGGSGLNCTFRDAVAAAQAAGVGNVTFSPTVFATPQTITLSSPGGAIRLYPNTTITGPTGTVSGKTVNLVTIHAGTSPNSGIFDTNYPSTPGVVITNLNLTGATYIAFKIEGGGVVTASGLYVYGNNSGIANYGTITVSNSTFTGNQATSSQNGSALYNQGTMTVNNCTFSGNTSYDGGAVGNGGNSGQNGGTLRVSNSTFYNNYASHQGGGVYSVFGSGTTLTNNIFANNSVQYGPGNAIYQYPGSPNASNNVFWNNLDQNSSGTDCYGCGGGIGTTASSNPLTLPLDNYGGATQTMLPQPGSEAICAGAATNILSGVSTDQRGYPNQNSTYPGYSNSSTCVDAGAVQTNYAVTFQTQPSSTTQTIAMNPAPVVALTESGTPFTASAVTIPLSLTGPGALSGGSAATSSGNATYPALSVDTAGTGDTLTATLNLNAAASPAPAISATSDAFDVIAIVKSDTTVSLLASPNPTITGQTVTLTAGISSAGSGTPTGSVSFYDGATLLGSVALSGVQAQLATRNLNAGTHSLSAVYSGDLFFNGNTSNTVQETLNNDATAHVISPANGATNVDASQMVQITWTSVGSPQAYYLYVGTTLGGTNVYTSGQTLNTSVSLALNAQTTYYLRLFTKQNNGWSSVDSSFSTGQLGKSAIITSPANGATNIDSTSPVTVSWIGGMNVSSYYLYVGTTVGTANVYGSGETTATSTQVHLQPSTVYYCRIFTKNTSNSWSYTDSSFTTGNQGAPAAIITPANGTTNVDGSIPISVTWNTVSGAISYYLYVGTTVGASDVYASGETTNSSASLTRYINPSTTYYVRLFTKFSFGWKYRDTTFTTGAQQLMAYVTSPANSATGVTHPSVTIQWSAATNPQAYFLYVGSTLGARDVYATGQTLNTQATVNGLAASTTYYLRMWTKNAVGVWHYNDSTFTTGP